MGDVVAGDDRVEGVDDAELAEAGLDVRPQRGGGHGQGYSSFAKAAYQLDGAGEGEVDGAIGRGYELGAALAVIGGGAGQAEVLDELGPAGLRAHVPLELVEGEGNAVLGEHRAGGPVVDGLAIDEDTVHVEDDRGEGGRVTH